MESGDYDIVLYGDSDVANGIPNAVLDGLADIADGNSAAGSLGIVTFGQFAEVLEGAPSVTQQSWYESISPLDCTGGSVTVATAGTVSISDPDAYCGLTSLDAGLAPWYLPNAFDALTNANDGSLSIDGSLGTDDVMATQLLSSGTTTAYIGADYLHNATDETAFRSGAYDQLLEYTLANAVGAENGLTVTGSGILAGTDFGDSITGQSGDDVLIGNAGDDFLTGGDGDDLFMFENGSDDDTITDFQEGAGSDDVIDVSDFGFIDLSDLLAATNDSGSDTVITLDGDDSLTLIGVQEANLHEDDFIF